MYGDRDAFGGLSKRRRSKIYEDTISLERFDFVILECEVVTYAYAIFLNKLLHAQRRFRDDKASAKKIRMNIHDLRKKPSSISQQPQEEKELQL